MKRAVINVKSIDKACFAWAVVADLYPAERDSARPSSYPHYSTVLNLQDIEFPVTIQQFKKIEFRNNLSINVYTTTTKKDIVPIRVTQHKKEKHINLLYMQDTENNNVGYFTWVKNLLKLVRAQLSKMEHKKYICDRCLHHFAEEKLRSHEVDCGAINDCAIRLPSDTNK